MADYDELETADRQKLARLADDIAAAQRQGQPVEPQAAVAPEEGRSSRVGSELVGAVLAGVGLGYLIDQQLGSGPVGVMVGLFAGFVAGVANAWRVMNGVERAVGLRAERTPDEKDKD